MSTCPQHAHCQILTHVRGTRESLEAFLAHLNRLTHNITLEARDAALQDFEEGLAVVLHDNMRSAMLHKAMFRVGMLRQMFPTHLLRIERGECPTCSHVITYDEFRTKEDLTEFHISGMCQTCQDDVARAEGRATRWEDR